MFGNYIKTLGNYIKTLGSYIKTLGSYFENLGQLAYNGSEHALAYIGNYRPTPELEWASSATTLTRAIKFKIFSSQVARQVRAVFYNHAVIDR